MRKVIRLSITVDSVYDAVAVKKELEYLLPYVESELFDTCSNITALEEEWLLDEEL